MWCSHCVNETEKSFLGQDIISPQAQLCPTKKISTNRLFCFWQEKSKTVSPWKLITGAHIASRIDMSNSHREATQKSHPKVWDHQKEIYTEATKTKTSSFGEQWWKYGTWHRWEKNHHIAKFKQKQQCQKHNFRSEKPLSFLIESIWSNHLIRIA